MFSPEGSNVECGFRFRGDDVGSDPAFSIVGTTDVRSMEYRPRLVCKELPLRGFSGLWIQ